MGQGYDRQTTTPLSGNVVVGSRTSIDVSTITGGLRKSASLQTFTATSDHAAWPSAHQIQTQYFRRTFSDSKLYSPINTSSRNDGTIVEEDERKNFPLKLPYESDNPILYLMESLKEDIWKTDNVVRRTAAVVTVLDSALETNEQS